MTKLDKDTMFQCQGHSCEMLFLSIFFSGPFCTLIIYQRNHKCLLAIQSVSVCGLESLHATRYDRKPDVNIESNQIPWTIIVL